jgi:hypothetical protein
MTLVIRLQPEVGDLKDRSGTVKKMESLREDKD